MREQFPLLEQCTYLNTAYTAPLSSSLMKWREADEKKYFDLGDQYKIKIEKDHYVSAQKGMALFAGSTLDRTFITGNFSSAFQNFIVHLPTNSHFLLLKDEYPSLTAIVKDHGFSFDELPITFKVEEQVWKTLNDTKYDVLALSAIQYTSGMYFDFEWLKKIKKAFPELLILVDGTQFIGAEVFDFNSSAIDALFGSTYKWLMAGHGTGFALVKSRLPPNVNISSKQLQSAYDRGQLSVKAVGSLAFALKCLNEQNFQQLVAQKNSLASMLKSELVARKLLDETIVNRHHHSSIFKLNLSEEVYKKLLIKDVRCMQRGNGVRIALHIYNNTHDVNRFLTIIDSLI